MAGVLSLRSEKLLNRIFSPKKKAGEDKKARPEVQNIFKLLQTRRKNLKRIKRL